MSQRDDELDFDDLDAFISEQASDPSFLNSLADAQVRSNLLATLLEVRRSSALTQVDVASAMGTTQSAVSELEGGDTDPRLSTLQRYARAVGRPLHLSVGSPTWSRAVIFPVSAGFSLSITSDRLTSAISVPQLVKVQDVPLRSNDTFAIAG